MSTTIEVMPLLEDAVDIHGQATILPQDLDGLPHTRNADIAPWEEPVRSFTYFHWSFSSTLADSLSLRIPFISLDFRLIDADVCLSRSLLHPPSPTGRSLTRLRFHPFHLSASPIPASLIGPAAVQSHIAPSAYVKGPAQAQAFTITRTLP